MKTKILILALLLLSGIELPSQNIIDPQPIYNKTIDTNKLGRVYQQDTTKFLRGWNWAGKCGRLDSAMDINTYHNYWTDTDDHKYGLMVMQTLEMPTTNKC